MTIPKWILPVLAIVAAVAVGAAAVLIGMRFTPPTTPTLTTQTAPVIAPATPTDGDSPFSVSPVVGEQQIVSPGQDGVGQIDANAQAEIDALNAHHGVEPHPASDGGTGSGSGSSGGSAADDPGTPLAADDPCAVSDPPAGCPLGVTGIVLADDHLPAESPLYLRPDPGTDHHAGIYCDPGTSTPGNIWVAIATSVPMADITVQYSPASNPAAEQTVHVVSDHRAWDAYHTAHHAYDPGAWFNNCVHLTGLASGRYSISASATDVFGRSPLPVVATFDSRGRPTEPPMTATPLNNNLLFVSVPSPAPTSAARPTIRAWVVAPGEPADCTTFDVHGELPTLAPQAAYDVDHAWLVSQNYDATYQSRDTVVYAVPEGAQVVVCARWYRTTSHSWESHVSRQRSLVASSPDRVNPKVSIESIDLAKQVQRGTLNISISTPSGFQCGSAWIGPETAQGPGSLELNAPLCDTSNLGYDGRLAVSTSVNIGSADHPNRIQSSAVMQLERRQCTGTCPVNEYSNYLVSLPNVTHGTGLCGSSFGSDCTPPSETTSLGRVVLRVDWTQGRTNGLAHWQIGAMDSTTPGDTTDAAPQFDTTVFPTPGYLADGFTGTLGLAIVTDRGAHYRATISGDCFLPGATPHVLTGVRADHLVSGPPDLLWEGLCPNSTYFITVELWDAAGHRATYGFPGDSAAHRWPGGEAFIPAQRLDVTALMSNGPMARDHNSYGIRYISVDITPGGGLAPIVPAQPCVAANRPLELLHGTGQVQQAHTYTVTVTVHAFNQDTSEESTGGPASQCGYVRASYATSVFTGTFTYEQLVQGGGVRIQGDGVFTPESSTANFAGFHTDLQLTATPHVGP